MLQEIDLRRLSQLAGPERACLSLYASGEASLRSLDHRADRVRSLLDEGSDEREHFERSLERLRAWLGDFAFNGHPGVCVFSCWALDLVEGYPLSVAPPDLFRLGPAPYLRPLAELQEEYETFLIVAADNRATRIFTVTAGEADEEERVRGDVKNRVKKGGWSQKRYSRRRDQELLHYAKEIGQVVDDLVRSEGIERIVLLGSEETLQELEDVLPEHLADRVIGHRAVDLHEGKEALVEQGFELYFEEERRNEERNWERIEAEYLSHGLAALGPTDVVEAAAVGRVELALVTRDAEIRGTECRECEAVVHGSPSSCQRCGSKSVFELDLVDALARMVESTSARIDFVDPIPGLSEAGDMAALLRY